MPGSNVNCRCDDSYAGYQIIDIMAKTIKQRFPMMGDLQLFDICKIAGESIGINVFKCGEHYKPVLEKYKRYDRHNKVKDDRQGLTF